MSGLVDWNCDILSCMRVDAEPFGAEAIDALVHLRDTQGFDSFCMMPILDVTKEPVTVFLLKRAAYEAYLASHLPRDFSVRFSARVLLQPNLSDYVDLEKLTDATNGYLPILLPIGEYQDWIDLELNHLLYRRKCKLLFMGCELFPILYPRETVEKLFRISGAAYQFHYHAFEDHRTRRMIHNLFSLNKTILLGSGVNSLQKAWRFDYNAAMSLATCLFSNAEWQRLLLSNRAFWKR